jgi:hypothetical protein
MAATTFAALFLAHVLADYLLQTRWMVVNKRRPAALGLHIGTVAVAMPAVFLTLSPWFLAVAGMHLVIDIAKTFVMRPGLASYIADQALHLASLVLVALLAPALWAGSPLAAIPGAAMTVLVLAALIFAARGGQYAVATVFGLDPETDGRGVWLGWAERSAMVAAVAAGWPALALLIPLAKAVQVARDPRPRLRQGAILSMLWGAATAAGLWAVLPLLP